MTALFKFSFVVAGLTSLASGASLKLANNYSGNDFFSGFRFNQSLTDPTNFGNIHYANQSVATASKLAFVNPAGNVILQVDNTTSDPAPGPFSTFGRNTVMMISNEPITIGTLVAMDATHIPFGCSVWPSFWTLDATNGTDEGGEIDIIEYVNQQTTNQYSLHTRAGCTLTNSSSFPSSGSVVSTNCDAVDFNVTGNQGCVIEEKASTNSVGKAFAANGGGVYAMYWTTDGIQLWFFEARLFFDRSNIPSDLTKNSPDPSSWGTPSAAYPAQSCDPSTFFNNRQNLIIDTDLCGAFAGNADVFTSSGCTGQCQTVISTASNYDDAYWEIQYIKTFNTQGSTSASASGTSTATGANGSATGTSGTSAGDRSWSLSALAVAGAALVASVVFARA
ncbi:hypothetical protein PUNSTDRAFT_126037 [Punctularia strigosozonata HHB-11173 SS5]|uniref:uncharacterized protein n=1 Tax=Punctularia strigosozonata (strain HHB-11173) TaxID=741275 RepID=UPI0004416750|nr:uncharacterized protein PUNSTDRAFT_126037 [Punctularia strigosozonata HHB-11173 SS5]EIN08731.1 hypothetical protein PUNSTDRAFT_126037 [Punctularia strigosozonata HHB-11173 SS5]